MPLGEPRQYRDKSDDWLELFHAKRKSALAGLVTPELVEQQRTLREPETNQRHAHLRLVMNYIRLAPAVGKSFVYAEKPYARYRVGYVTERGVPARLDDAPVFETEREARHHVLLMRLKDAGLAPKG